LGWNSLIRRLFGIRL